MADVPTSGKSSDAKRAVSSARSARVQDELRKLWVRWSSMTRAIPAGSGQVVTSLRPFPQAGRTTTYDSERGRWECPVWRKLAMSWESTRPVARRRGLPLMNSQFPRACVCLLVVLTPVVVSPQDTPNTRRDLEALQLRAYQNLGIAPEKVQALAAQSGTVWIAHCKENRVKLSRSRAIAETSDAAAEAECRRLLDQVPTRYENPPDYAIVRERFDQIHSVATSIDRALLFRPLLGTIAQGELGGESRRPTGYVLVINGGALRTSWTLAKILALSLPTVETNPADPLSVDWPEIRKHLQQTQEPSRRFRELLDAIVVRKHPYFAPSFLIDRDKRATLGFVKALNAGIELFLVGHEYAHITDGHLDGKIRRGVPGDRFLKESITVEGRTFEPNLRYSSEFDADQLGLILTYKALEAMHVTTDASIIGAVLSLRAVEILGRAQALGKTTLRPEDRDLCEPANCDTEPSGETHPPTSCRIRLLKHHVKQPNVLKTIELMERTLTYLCTGDATR